MAQLNRRHFLKSAAALPILSAGCVHHSDNPRPNTGANPNSTRRVRPGDAAWPSDAKWVELRQQVEGRLVKLHSPLEACRVDPESASCQDVLKHLKNQFYIGDEPALTQMSGWAGAWSSTPSVYAVEAERTEDVVAAVNFAREHNLRLVVKGGGHSYQGTSNSPDSLLVWTRKMNDITMLDSFVAQGCEGIREPQPAVDIGAGAMWVQAYDAVTTRGGRYVQGGGCTTVGVAGLVQSGGFGNFSKNYGMAAAGLLEAEIVTADGKVRIANECANPDLFWGIKGGGGGSLGVVTRLTLRTRELPMHFGAVFGTIKAKSDGAYRRLVSETVEFYRTRLFNRHWGEQIVFRSGNKIRFSMVFQGLNREEAAAVWKPFISRIENAPDDFAFEESISFLEIPARRFWDADFLRTHFPEVIVSDDRPGAPASNFMWAGDRNQAGNLIHGYRSAWLQESLLHPERQGELVGALVASAKIWDVSLHFNKGLAGAPEPEREAARNTATHPAAVDAFALAIIAGEGEEAFKLMPDSSPDLAEAGQHARSIDRSMTELLKVIPDAGSYVSESNFFETSWQKSFWGPNYPQLLAVKKQYDPNGLFFVHHGVGSEDWSPDGFERL